MYVCFNADDSALLIVEVTSRPICVQLQYKCF